MLVRGPKSGFRKTIFIRRALRHNLTAAEKLFWSKVRGRQFRNIKFRKQHGIGNYIADFYCPQHKLVIEIDGDSHSLKKNQVYDKKRTGELESLGYQVIRYNNSDILQNIEGVMENLAAKLSLL